MVKYEVMNPYVYITCAALCFTACTEELSENSYSDIEKKIRVSIENDVQTKVQLNHECKIVWNEGDLVRIFNPEKPDVSEIWRFDGKTGDTEGTLSFVKEDEYGCSMFSPYVAIYPANQLIRLDITNASDVNDIIIPRIQVYQKDTYAANTNVMVAIYDDEIPSTLQFKNLMGYIKLQLIGRSKVSRIELLGNNEEEIATENLFLCYGNPASNWEVCGEISSGGNDYKIINNYSFDDSSEIIVLDCGKGVPLSIDNATTFYIGLIPTVFENGITVTVYFDDGSSMTKSTANKISVARNHIVPMEVFLCEPQITIPDNELWYTSRLGLVKEPKFPNSFDVNIISNTYSNGKGIIKFDGPLTYIGSMAMSQLDGLVSVTMPNSVTGIGTSSFWNSNISHIDLSNNLTEIGSRSFENNNDLVRIVIPENVTAIYDEAFYDCKSLETVVLPLTLSYIGESTFSGCLLLSDIKFPDNLSYVGSKAFMNTDISSVDLPETVTYIGEWAFRDCKNLRTASFPNGITEIEAFMFSGCANLEVFDIPSNVTNIGKYAFSGCSSLTAIDIPSSVTTIDDYAFSGCGIEYARIPDNLDVAYGIDGLFNGCERLVAVDYPEGLDIFGEAAFSGCSSLKAITLPSHITAIRDSLFRNCSSLTEINIPSGVSSIGSYSFAGCSNLTTIDIPAPLGYKSIDDHAFEGCEKLTNIIIPDGISFISTGTFSGCTGLKVVEIPESVSTIRNEAFKNCSSLENVDLSKNEISILYSSVFQGCAKLESLILPESLYQIERNALNGCSSLSTITLPEGVKQIEANAFYGCSSLTEIYCKAKVPPVLGNSSVFAMTPANMIIYVPSESLTAYKSAQYWAGMQAKLVGYDF